MTPVRSSSLVALALLAAACDLPYPPGSYEPEPVDVETVAAEAGMPSPDGGEPAFGGLGGTNGGAGGNAGGTQGGTQGGVGGGTDAGGGTGGPLDALAGDYYVRVDQYNRSTGSGTTVSTHAISYLVAKLVVLDGVLKMADRQCFIQ